MGRANFFAILIYQADHLISARRNITIAKGMNPLICPAFYKDGFGIKLSKKVFMPLNQIKSIVSHK